MTTMSRCLQCVLLLLAALSALCSTVSSTQFRVEWSQSGSLMTMSLQDIDKTPVTIDVPTTVTIEAVNGKVRGLNGTFKESFARTIEPGHTIPPFELLSDSLVTGEMSLIATVAPEGKTVVQSTKSMTLQPSWWLCLSAAVTGALGWAIYSFFSGAIRTLTRFFGSAGAGAFAGVIAFAAAKIEPLWKAIGLNADTFQLQTYLLLGVIVAYRGVSWTLGKLTGESDAKPLRPNEVLDQITEIITGDAVRVPIREEMQSLLLLNSEYLNAAPTLLARVETSLMKAKYGDVPDGLPQFLKTRLDQLYTISHRENLNTILDIRLNPDWFEWHDVTTYDYVRNPRDPRRDPDVRYAHVEDVPAALQKEGKEKLEQLGTMAMHLRVKVSSDRFGELVYDATSGNKLVRTKAPENSSAPTELTILITYDEAKHELSFAYDFSMPPPFDNERRVAVELTATWRGKAEDGIYAFRLARLTRGYHLSYSFNPNPRHDRVLVEWKPLWEHYQEDEKKPGIVHLPGWLLPGNGICLSYSGTDRACSSADPVSGAAVIK